MNLSLRHKLRFKFASALSGDSDPDADDSASASLLAPGKAPRLLLLPYMAGSGRPWGDLDHAAGLASASHVLESRQPLGPEQAAESDSDRVADAAWGGRVAVGRTLRAPPLPLSSLPPSSRAPRGHDRYASADSKWDLADRSANVASPSSLLSPPRSPASCGDKPAEASRCRLPLSDAAEPEGVLVNRRVRPRWCGRRLRDPRLRSRCSPRSPLLPVPIPSSTSPPTPRDLSPTPSSSPDPCGWSPSDSGAPTLVVPTSPPFVLTAVPTHPIPKEDQETRLPTSLHP